MSHAPLNKTIFINLTFKVVERKLANALLIKAWGCFLTSTVPILLYAIMLAGGVG